MYAEQDHALNIGLAHQAFNPSLSPEREFGANAPNG